MPGGGGEEKEEETRVTHLAMNASDHQNLSQILWDSAVAIDGKKAGGNS